MIERGIPFRATDAVSDWRIPMRIGVVIAGLLVAWAVVVLVNRQGLLGAGTDAERRIASWPRDRRTWILVLLYALSGATIALLLMLRQNSFCVRAPDGLSCSYKSFLGWDTAPILAEVLVTVVGAAGGTGLGLLVARLQRSYETSGARSVDRASA